MKNKCFGCGKKIFKIIEICKTPPCDLFLRNKKKFKFYSLDLMFCKKCFLIRTKDIVKPSEIYSKYLYKTSHSSGLKDHFRKYSLDIKKKLKLKKNSYILDIGCNDGTFLEFFKKMNFKTLGVDPANNIKKDCEKKGIKIFNKFFDTNLANKILNNYSINLVTANNVIANIPRINNFFSNVNKVLQPDGYFVFETIYGPQIIEKKLIDMINNEHIYYFSFLTLKKILHNNGFEIINYKISKSKGGSIRIFSKKNKNINITRNFLVEKKEIKSGFNDFKKLKKLNKLYKNFKINFIKKFNKLSFRYNKIDCYGASAGSTSLIFFFKIFNKVNCIYDDNKLRHNLYLPGTKLKVQNSGDIKKKRPKLIIVLAWRYIDKILKRNKKIFKNNITVYNILPNLKKINIK